MGSAAFAFRVMCVMAVAFAAASRYLAVPALRIVGRRLLDMERLLGVFVRSAWAALADARRRFC
jgi:hypothetical protein